MDFARSTDVVIIGCGTAGAAAAGFCAERGLRVICLERRRLSEAGARWVNGVPAQAFVRAGLPLPRGDELRGGNQTFHLLAGFGPTRISIRDHGVLEVDMRLLVARLQARALRLGARLLGETGVLGLEPSDSPDRHSSAVLTDRGLVHGRWIIDASGLGGAGLLRQPRVLPQHLCAAAQEVRQVADLQGARAFFARHRVPFGDVLCFSGIAGGFSILSVRIGGDHVGILTGSIPAAGQPPGKALLDDFVASQPWIGAIVFGGAGAIPVRRPYDRLTDGRVAVLGDAACQVFPAHGSGIGPGLVAARVLADSLASGHGLVGYQAAWQRAHGSLLGSYEVFRRFSQTLSSTEIAAMMEHGLLAPATARHGMAQRWPRLELAALSGTLRGLTQCPDLGRRLAGTVARMLAVRAHYARYPHNPARLPAWSRRAAQLAGDSPDIL